MGKKIVIVGASSAVGRQLVPKLAAAGCELVLLDSDQEKLATVFPGHMRCSDQNWQTEASGADALLNISDPASCAHTEGSEIERSSVQLPCELARTMRDADISQFIQIADITTLNDNSMYARNERSVEQQLAQLSHIQLNIIYIPLIWGSRWPKRLTFLDACPDAIARAIFRPLAAFRPTLHIDRLVSAITDSVGASASKQVVSDNIDNNVWYRGVSAIIDYGFALSVLFLFWWALLAIMVWVKVTSPGPAIFAQQRVGKHGKPFVCYKFRTMKTGTRQAGTHEVSQASVTPVGAILRRTKLDELPQALNILKGEVRLVGPRPGLPVQEELFQARQAAGVFDVTPGITGWAQINDIDMSDPQRLAHWDADYIGMRSLIFDIQIILSTAFGRGQGDRTAGDHPT